MQKSIHTAQNAELLKLLIETRLEAKVSQVELAKRLQTTQSSVSKVERGERRLDIVELYAWCRALKLPLIQFVAEFERRVR